jgi:predicted KAP-like P-loop ATPase
MQESTRTEFATSNESLLNDHSIGETGDDFLGYTKYADELAKKILSSNFEKSFAIGINGKCGLGKTSFVDHLKRKVKDKDLITVDFNPWNSQTPQAIIRDFF